MARIDGAVDALDSGKLDGSSADDLDRRKDGLVLIKYRHGSTIGSSSLLADAANDGSIFCRAAVALAALSLTLWKPVDFMRADHYGAFAVGIIVIVSAGAHDACRLDESDGHDAGRCRHGEDSRGGAERPRCGGGEKCFARKTGLRYHVDLHLEVDPEITVRASHEIAGRVRDKIREEIPWVADVLVHVEPWPGQGFG